MKIFSQNLTRTISYNIQVKASLIFRVLSVMFMFFLVPIVIKHLGIELYGIWSTMLTLISWVVLLDLGIGNGLRNSVSRCFASNDMDDLASEISTAYAIAAFFSIVIVLLYLVFRDDLNWQVIFNSTILQRSDFLRVVDFLVIGISINFFISLVLQIYHGMQLSSVVVMAQMLTNFLVLVGVSLFAFFYPFSLLNMVVIYIFSLVAVNFSLSVFLFSKNPNLMPRISRYKMVLVRPFFALGAQFFAIQCAVLVVFMTDKLLISQLLGPTFVTGYDVVFKLFSVFTLVHSLILVPLWSSYSDAYASNDMVWINNQVRRQILIAIALISTAIGMGFLAPYIVNIWVGDTIVVEPVLYWVFVIYIAVSTWNNVFAYLVNALGKLKVQMFTSIIAAAFNIPLSIYFVKYLGFGVEGVLYATVCCLLFYAILGPVEVYRLLRA